MIFKGEGCEPNIEVVQKYFELAQKKGCEKGDNFLMKQQKGKENNVSNNINEMFYETL